MGLPFDSVSQSESTRTPEGFSRGKTTAEEMMQSGNRTNFHEGRQSGPEKDLVRIAFLAALATSISTVEVLIPRPLPWLRLGLANAMVLTGIVFFGLRAALFITVMKSCLSSIFSRTFLGPGFLLSFSGSITSALAMWTVYRICTPYLTLAGVSVVGATFHNIAQLSVAYLTFLRNTAVFYLVPVMLYVAIPAGLLTGYLAHRMVLILLPRWGLPAGRFLAGAMKTLYNR
jgi:heptaprenyl diphosphate synthase